LDYISKLDSDFFMKIPVVLIIFRRPDKTLQVLEKIRQVKPSKLFVICDAPRPEKPDESEKCEKSRAVIDTIDWDCEVIKNYADTNLGSFRRIPSGLDWVFDQVEEAIVLEDDCLPDITFFRFCEELLEYYKNDQRIMAISGDNFQLGNQRTQNSYYFSRYTHSWGWATWKRAWKHFDMEMSAWPKVRDQQLVRSILDSDRDVKYWTAILQDTYESKIKAWDYRWTLSVWLQNGLTILPNVNLISNIGFGEGATHTVSTKNPWINLPTQSMNFPLQHPQFVIRDSIADKFTQDSVFNATLKNRLILKLRNMVKTYEP
jgi:hypothetical protein